MSFLQPWLLAALPVAALPIVIHLINQRRFQSVQWAAMRFLLEANRMSRGYNRIRQWLILLARVLAIAALVFVVSRPLSRGWLGLAGGGRADTTLILLDRSPSMQQLGAGGERSKLQSGVEQLVRTLSTLGSTRWVLIDSVSCQPQELESIESLLQSPRAEGASAAADVPAMLQAAYDYVKTNRTGETEIWICSDLRSNDWNVESSRWAALRDGFAEFRQSVRFHLLAYGAPAAEGNLSVRVSHVERRTTSDGGAELLISVALRRDGGAGKQAVPLAFDIAGARSGLAVELDGAELELANHRIPLERGQVRGWGRVAIPADHNGADNEFYFAFDVPPPRRTVIVADEGEDVRALELAARISPDGGDDDPVDVLRPGELGGARWDQTALVLWQAPLPDDEAAATIRRFVERGGQVVFFPPQAPGESAWYGVRWAEWVSPREAVRVETWRGDHDLLARTQSGAALPVGELVVRRYCKLTGEQTPLATLPGGAPLLARVPTDRGGAYFCATTVAANNATLSTDGVALYVALQRALAAGAAELAGARQVEAGSQFPAAAMPWQSVAGAGDALSTELPCHAGVYASPPLLLAVNRPAIETSATVLGEARVAGLFRGLDFDRVNDDAGNVDSLAREVWRLFLGTMLAAVVVEAALCLPRTTHPPGERR